MAKRYDTYFFSSSFIIIPGVNIEQRGTKFIWETYRTFSLRNIYLLHRDKVTILFRIFPTKVNEVFFLKDRTRSPSFIFHRPKFTSSNFAKKRRRRKEKKERKKERRQYEAQ